MTAEANQDVSMAFKSALIERALGGELSHHSALRYRGWSSTTRTSLSAWGVIASEASSGAWCPTP